MTPSSLVVRFFTLSVLAALVSCSSKIDGPDRKSGIEGLIDAETKLLEFECECWGDEDFGSTQACLDEVGDYFESDQEYLECLERVLATDAQARQVFECYVDTMYDYLECLGEEGCPEQFTCNDGSTIPSEWVCDGDQDCAAGEDEAGDCDTEPFVCANGESIPRSFVCDTYPDCMGGEDEQGCPDTCIRRVWVAIEACGDPSDAFLDRLDEECYTWDEGDVSCLDGGCASFPPDAATFRFVEDSLPPSVRAILPALVLKLRS
jgi:hypothetical protein